MADHKDEDIKYGVLKKREAYGLGCKWKEKFFVITSEHTIAWWKDFKEGTSSRRKLKSKQFTSLSGSTLRTSPLLNPNFPDIPLQEACFQIHAKDGTVLSLCANTEHEAREWIETLRIVLDQGRVATRDTVQIQLSLRRAGQDISPSDLDIQNENIGKGASGVVRPGRWLKTTDVAVKLLNNLPEFTEKEELIGFFKEIETLSKLRHSNIVQMYGFCRKDSYICLVTELVRGGNLAKCLADKTFDLNMSLQIQLTLSICRGMVYLHNQGVIHRDLKPANILVESWEEGKVKVCDFGLSTVVKQNSSHTGGPGETGLGSPQYAAPELSNDNHDNKVDVFSFSIILYEISTRESPWPEITFGSDFANRYKSGERPPVRSDNIWKEIIAKCWLPDPAKRPNFQEIYAEIEKFLSTYPADTLRKTSRPSSMVNLVPSNSNSPADSPTTYHRSPTPSYHQDSVPNLTNGIMNMRPLARDYVAEQIAKEFQGKTSIPWDKFCAIFEYALTSPSNYVNELKFVFVNKEGNVLKATWDDFAKWFTPLRATNIYETEGSGNDGWDIESIMAICRPSWFHGFLGSSEAQRMLKGQPEGTFLIRFSTTNPGSYALSVAYGATVGHWRIASESQSSTAQLYKIDDLSYTSLSQVVDTHRKEPLKIKRGQDCLLTEPLERERYYNN